MRRDIDIMVSARWLMKVPRQSKLYGYIKEFNGLFLDSGAFGSAFWDGGYKYTTGEYLELVDRMQPEFWATMDYPCEPNILPGMTVGQRIEKTITNTIELKGAGIAGLVAVIQGWEIADYEVCGAIMRNQNLLTIPTGVGSICRRGKQGDIVAIVSALARLLGDVKFHAFGAKLSAIRCNNGELMNYLHSLDTAAWQLDNEGGGARRCNTVIELDKRLNRYKSKVDNRLSLPYQLGLRHFK